MHTTDVTASLEHAKGSRVTLTFFGVTNGGLPTLFYLDDVELSVTGENDPGTVPLTSVSTDAFPLSLPGEHRSEVEPASFSNGSTLVSAFQVGRIQNGGATGIGWATQVNGYWRHGILPYLTRNASPKGPYDRASDASVAYDAAHQTWLISSLALRDSGGDVTGAAITVSLSSNGSVWTKPTVIANANGGDLDKNWTTCDNTPTSPYYGHCYTEWDNNGNGDQIFMSTSIDGGNTWSAGTSPGGNVTGLGGEPLIQPNGTVIVPAAGANETSIIAFGSVDGGASWGPEATVADVQSHGVAGNLRTSPLPSSAMDAAGRVYVVWQDCRFNLGCGANDLVMSTSDDGVHWSPPARLPTEGAQSSADNFDPALGIEPTTSGASAMLALTYYYYPDSQCTADTCRLYIGMISSTDGGTGWSYPTKLAGPMLLSWLPSTSQGFMFGDYGTTSFVQSRAVPVFALASAPSGTTLRQGMYSVTRAVTGGSRTTLQYVGHSEMRPPGTRKNRIFTSR
ncbi:MAG: sialidase family protein [Chloroflexota bacterium]